MKTLQKRQFPSDHGWSYWEYDPRWTHQSHPYITIHVMNCISKSKEKGVGTDQATINRGLGYLEKIESHINSYYWWIDIKAKNALMSYSLYVRKKFGKSVEVEAAQLFNKHGITKFELDSLGFLLMSMFGSSDKTVITASETMLKVWFDDFY